MNYEIMKDKDQTHNHAHSSAVTSYPAAAHAESDIDASTLSYVCKFNAKNGNMECSKHYKRDILQQAINERDNDSERKIIDQLKEFGLTVYLTDTGDINLPILRKVVEHASSRSAYTNGVKNPCCLLYKDAKERLYNLTLNNGSSGLASTWQNNLISFSGLQSLVALTVLTTIFPCYNDDSAEGVNPAFPSLLISLILKEEISHVWLNCSMFIRGTPSIAAHTLISHCDSDWLGRTAVLLLGLAAISNHMNVDDFGLLTLIGVVVLMTALAANLGSRAWYFMKWQPFRGGGILAPILSYLLAIATGLIFPYLGFTKIQAGGKSSVQLIISNVLIVAIVFVFSGLESVRSYAKIGSEPCQKDVINMTVGFWLAMTSVTCIFASQKIKPIDLDPSEDYDPLLIEDHSSPVGYRVPNFPEYKIDPILFGSDGLSFLSLRTEITAGLIIGVGVGAWIASTGVYSYMESVDGYLS